MRFPKTILSFLTFFSFFNPIEIFSQNFDYTKKWAEIEKNEQNGAFKSNLPLVNEVLANARKDGKKDQIIKGLLFQSKIFLQTIEEKEEPEVAIVKNFEIEIANANGVDKALLQYTLAKMYEQYYNQKQWQINKRTKLQTTPKDFREWTNRDFYSTIRQYYMEAIKMEKELYGAKLKDYSLIIVPNEINPLKPTWLDIIISDAERFFANKEENFRVQDNEKDENTHFIKKAKDELAAMHKSNENASAYLYWKSSGLANKIENEVAFDNLINEFPSDPYAAHLMWQKALIFTDGMHQELRKSHQSGQKMDLVKAKNICLEAQKRYPNSPYLHNANELIKSIDWKWATFKVEQSPLANQAIPIIIEHRNLDKVFIKIYEVTPEINTFFQSKIETPNNKTLNIKGKEIRTLEVPLKSFSDYLTHTYLYPIEGLPTGQYAFIISNRNSITGDHNENFVNYTVLSISDQIVLRKNDYEANTLGLDLHILNKKTGRPMAKSEWTLYRSSGDYDKRRLEPQFNFTTDEKGLVHLSAEQLKINKGNYYERQYVIQSKSTSEIVDLGYLHFNNYNHTEHQFPIANIFTDRSIYRPSQKLYFKSIVYQKDKDQSSLLKNTAITAKLIDPNQKMIAELKLITNEFGSANGEFTLPKEGITGTCRLEIFESSSNRQLGQTNFNIEEYKRPKFEVIFNPLNDDYLLNQNVEVKGSGVAFSGAKISDAKVKYRVIREERFFFSFPWYYWRRGWRGWGWQRETSPEEIAQGTTQTDADGAFSIPFNTQTSQLRKDLPRSFEYKILVDITDINGETQSGEIRLNAGDVPLRIHLNAPKKISSKQFNSLTIKTTNLNGQKKSAKGTLKIFELIEPNRVIKPNSITNLVEYKTISDDDFLRKFPYESLVPNENKPQQWERKLVKEIPFDTEKSDTINLNVKNWKYGNYVLEASSVWGKDTVSQSEYVEIFDDITKRSTNYQFLSAHLDKEQYSIGDKARITFHSGLENATVFVSLANPSSWMAENQMIQLVNGTGIYEFTITEAQKYGIQINYYTIFQNAYHQNTVMANVKPQKDYSLKFSTKTFRDKLQPGVGEKWQLTISGKDRDKLAAEVLANMYDASLDQFLPHNYLFNPRAYSPFFRQAFFHTYQLGEQTHYLNQASSYPNFYHPKYKQETWNQLNFFNFYFGNNYYYNYSIYTKSIQKRSVAPNKEMELANDGFALNASAPVMQMSDEKQEVPNNILKKDKTNTDTTPTETPLDTKNIKVRTNLNETAFFFPTLMTDAEGNFKIEFTTPEALTKWKLMLVGHTQELHSGVSTLYVQTQKDLMVVPNAPRFLRESDEIILMTKISNLTASPMAGSAKLELFDAFSLKPIDAEFSNTSSTKSFNAKAGGNAAVEWKLNIPNTYQAIVYRIIAKAGDFSDGEENTLPVLPNRMLVTETMPISVREGQTKTFTFDKLKNQTSSTLQSFNLALEVTTNPIWTVIGALPYLREYPYECNEQLFSRLYGNALSTHIMNTSPKIKKVFDNWNEKGIQVSNLEKNQELKQLLLEETPWLRDAQSETEQMKRIAVFFELNKMTQELKQVKEKLKQRQMANGAFTWYGGDRPDVYITNHIIGGMGKLKKMLGDNFTQILGEDINEIYTKAINFSDDEMLREWQRIAKKDRKWFHYTMLHYLYARSNWKNEKPLPSSYSSIQNEVFKEMMENYLKQDIGFRGMLALVLNRYDRSKDAEKVLNSVEEQSTVSEEFGKYWKVNQSGWEWHQAPIETQTILIECYNEIKNDIESVEAMKVWLIKNKQTNRWNSTKATTEAIYALMAIGKSWLNAEEGITVKMGTETVYPPSNAIDPAPGVINASGYYKKSWKAGDIKPELGVINIEKKSPGVMYGGMFWQYFENLDKITPAQTNLKLKKELYLKVNTEKGPELRPISENSPIQLGDMVTVRCIIQTDRPLSYIHLKDMRGSGFEPVNVLSSYKYKDGLGYYESTRDAATNFFISYMAPGIYVFEYDVKAINKGKFSNGISTIQNMYAPEFSAHTQGITVEIKE